MADGRLVREYLHSLLEQEHEYQLGPDYINRLIAMGIDNGIRYDIVEQMSEVRKKPVGKKEGKEGNFCLRRSAPRLLSSPLSMGLSLFNGAHVFVWGAVLKARRSECARWRRKGESHAKRGSEGGPRVLPFSQASARHFFLLSPLRPRPWPLSLSRLHLPALSVYMCQA
jgi:hypothetical protein